MYGFPDDNNADRKGSSHKGGDRSASAGSAGRNYPTNFGGGLNTGSKGPGSQTSVISIAVSDAPGTGKGTPGSAMASPSGFGNIIKIVE